MVIVKYRYGFSRDVDAETMREACEKMKADLSGTDLTWANLTEANLTRADLTRANLTGANLTWANLTEANLTEANLTGANLTEANLTGANLTEANLSGANLPHFQLCPQDGAFVAYKATHEGVIKLEVPAEAKRTSSLVGRKCRAEFVRVLDMPDGGKIAHAKHDGKTEYRLGEIIRPDSYDDDIRVECTHGIHFFMTREEAEQW